MGKKLGRFLVAALCFSLMVPAHADCWNYAARKFELNRDLLLAIGLTESNLNPEAMNYTHQVATGSYDIGLMQINSRWLKKINLDEASLRVPCTNVIVAAWILSDLIRRMGPTWDAVGAYNAACVQLKDNACTAARMRYVERVRYFYERIQTISPVE